MRSNASCLRQLLYPLAERRRHSARQISAEKDALAKARRRLDEAREAQRLVQAAAEAAQNESHARLAGCVSRCLKAVFGEDAYGFAVRFAKKRGRTEAEFFLTRGGQEISPLDAAGGGVVDVVSFALRLACLLLSTPPKRRLLVLDECAKHLSREYQPLFGELLLEVAREFDLQILLVTHSEALRVGRVVEIG